MPRDVLMPIAPFACNHGEQTRSMITSLASSEWPLNQTKHPLYQENFDTHKFCTSQNIT